jgi:hypothetical protein
MTDLSNLPPEIAGIMVKYNRRLDSPAATVAASIALGVEHYEALRDYILRVTAELAALKIEALEAQGAFEQQDQENKQLRKERDAPDWTRCADRLPNCDESGDGYYWGWNENKPKIAPTLLEWDTRSRVFCHEAAGVVPGITHWQLAIAPAKPRG